MDIPEHGLTKLVWTDADFAQMSWHDSRLHGFHIDHDYAIDRYDFVFDLDYLTRWVLDDDNYFSFWISPVTLAFHNAHDIEMNIDSFAGDFEMDKLQRTESRLTPNGKFTEYFWVLEMQGGAISLWATGFTQYFRRWPVHQRRQVLTLRQRGGVSFARELETPNDLTGKE